MNILSYFAGHDANMSFYNGITEKYHIIELERIKKKRYFRLHHDNSIEEISKTLEECARICRDFWYMDNFDANVYTTDGPVTYSLVKKHFKSNDAVLHFDHHLCHAASCFYQSPYDECIIFSYDGGGNDGFFNIYKANYNDIVLIEKIGCDFGGAYMLLASCIEEITERSRHMLSLPGKMMGICAYGEPIKEYIEPMADFHYDKGFHKLGKQIGVDFVERPPWEDILNNGVLRGQEGFNFAASAQKGFEEGFLRVFDRIIKSYPDIPICITGGAALNVLMNERIKNEYQMDVFIPPNPNDCGLSLGALLLFQRPKHKINVTYNGVPLLDKNRLEIYVMERNATKTNPDEIATLLKEGNIIGICYGDSEVGPRALGNRSILCDPSYPDMKDTLNAKVKFREWFRPFAPFCRKEDAAKYFDSFSFEGLEFMSFAPKVKQEYASKLKSITHEDNTARLQTVTEEGHKIFYDILTSFSKIAECPVLLNTSFNIKGKPILTTIEDALHVLDNTKMDYVVVEDYLFKKVK